MLKERVEFVKNTVYAVDLIALTALFFLTHYFFNNARHFYYLDLIPGVDVIPATSSASLYVNGYWLAIVIWAVLLKTRGPQRLRFETYFRVVGRHLYDGVLFFIVFSSAAFVLKMTYFSRLFIAVYTVASVLAMCANHFAVLALAHQVRRKGHNYRNILLVGTGLRAKEFVKMVERHKEWGYRIAGVLDRNPSLVGSTFEGYKVMGTLEAIPGLLQAKVVDEVSFVVPRSWLTEIEQSILYCEAVGIPATLATDFFDLNIASGIPLELDGQSYLSFETRQLKDSELLIKRGMDLALSAAVLTIMSPVLLAVVCAIKLDSKGPVIFRQIRRGRNGRKFVLYKFRSMKVDAESQLQGLRHLNEVDGPVFKMDKDPRVTRVGRLLRRTSLDEFPQFWNVLMGDMSVVGPRPALSDEIEHYEPWQKRRLSMKPGITCIWQVSGRNQIGFDDWMKLDLRYIDQWSVWLDIKILFQTIRAVLTTRGAK